MVLHTSEGDLTFQLFCRECPKASFNFLALCASGYFNNTTFHRNVPGFLLQGGDPTGTGKKGESVYQENFFGDEGFGVTFHSQRGTLSMAHKGSRPNTNASQFFISYTPLPSLDGVNTVFGCLAGGHDALSKIEARPVDEKGAPLLSSSAVTIIDTTIVDNPFAVGLIGSPSTTS